MPTVAAAVARGQALRRAENALAKQTATALAQTRRSLLGLLAESDVWAVSSGRQERRLQAIFSKADAVIVKGFRRLNEQTREALVQVSAQHGKAVAAAMEKSLVRQAPLSLALPTKAEFRALATMTPVRGAPMRDWWGRQSQTTRRRFRDQVRLGYLNGEGVSEMSGRVEDALRVTSAQAEALVRTAVNSIANRAALETYKANQDVAPAYQYVAVLDDRTTEICEELDGEVWRLDDPAAKLPPQHWNCRSTTIPVVDWEALGLEPPDGAPDVPPET